MTRWFATALILVCCPFFAACSFFDFFSYREDTGLHVIDSPENYGNIKFGMELAPTQTPTTDLIAVSAGWSTPTLFYPLGQDGHLVDIGEDWSSYRDDDNNIEDSGTGASLAGLPDWFNRTGCVAIGEPESERVVFKCEGETSFARAGDGAEFGKKLSRIKPIGQEPWMLAVAGRDNAWLVGSFLGSETVPALSEKFWPAGQPGGEVTAIAAGRLIDQFYVAVTVTEPSAAFGKIFLFLQSETNPQEMIRVACLERPEEPGFGQTMTTGNVWGDDDEELIVSAGRLAAGRVDAVYVYDIGTLVDGVPNGANRQATCPAIPVVPIIELIPSPGERDVDCEEDCLFGATLSVGDIATDDAYPELLVGAPGARAKGTRRAGAVYVYRRNDQGNEPLSLAGQVIDSFPETGMEFGGGLAVAPMAGRNELLIGATGKGKVFVAFCTGVGENVKNGGDVTTDGSGSVVSTRCRWP